MGNLFSFRGRASRLTFISIVVASAVLWGALSAMLQNNMGPDQAANPAALSTAVVGWIFGFAVSLAVSVRRLHDTNKSGFFLLLGPIPVLNLYLLYLLFIKAGDDIANRFGVPPP